MHVSPGPAHGVPIQKTPSPVKSSVLPGPGGISSPKFGGGGFRSSNPHDGEAVESVSEAVGSSSLTTVSDCSDFNVSDRDSIVSVHSSLINMSISEVLAVEEDPILSRPAPRVESGVQTSLSIPSSGNHCKTCCLIQLNCLH